MHLETTYNLLIWKRSLIILFEIKKKFNDHGRTRTCNPQIRSLMPYPLGHAASDISYLIIILTVFFKSNCFTGCCRCCRCRRRRTCMCFHHVVVTFFSFVRYFRFWSCRIFPAANEGRHRVEGRAEAIAVSAEVVGREVFVDLAAVAQDTVAGPVTARLDVGDDKHA